MDGHHRGRAGWPPRRPSNGDPTGRHEAMPRRMVGQGAGPGVSHAQDPAQTAHIMGGRRERDERLGGRAEPEVGEVLLLTTDDRTECMGYGEDHVAGGDRQAVLPPLCQPGFGVEAMTRGATRELPRSGFVQRRLGILKETGTTSKTDAQSVDKPLEQL
jgi:hypothetical protein